MFTSKVNVLKTLELKMAVLMSLVFVMSSQPMSLVIMMMMMVFVYSVEMYLFTKTFWFSIVLMLVMLSGVMVVFTYMASMSPNSKFEMYLAGMMMLVLLSFLKEECWGEIMTNESLELWNMIVLMMNCYMIVFLMVIMIMVIWISGWWSGPVHVYWKNLFVSMKFWWS